MRPFVYVVIFAVVFLIFKAFFLDSYLKERSASEANTSVEVTQGEPSVVVEPEKNITKESSANSPKKDNKDMPLDRLGDEIADKLKGKL